MKKILLLTALTFALYGKVFSQVILNPIAGNPVVYTGWTLAGNAIPVNVDSAIQLTASTGGQSGRVYYSTAENVTACGQFSVNFDFRIIPPSTGLVADGMSFFFLSSPVGTASTGMALDIPPNPNGLVLVIDTYDNNGDGLNPEVPLYGYNGTVGGYTEGATPFRLGFLTHQNFTDDGSWHHCLITYNGGTIKVFFNYSAAASITAFYPITTAGQFGFSGSTGGAWSKQEIKNVYISANTVSPIMGNTSICQGSTSTLSDSTTGGTWSSSNTGVATVISGTGVVTGAGVGTATITYTFGTCTSTTIVTVNTQPTVITGTPTVCQGSTTALTDATAGGIWSSTVTTVATVGTDGTVTGGGIGTSTISYTIGTCAATRIVTVNTQPVAITGNTGPFCATFSMPLSDATTSGIWSSVTTTVATVTAGGVVTGMGAGTSTISYTIGSCAATTVVTVNTQPVAITGTPTVCQGFTTSLTDATGGGTWISTVITVATVGTDGTVTGGGVGTSTISYAIGSCAVTQIVTVNTQPAPITGNTGPFCATFSIPLSDATASGTWSSVATTVATVTGGGVVTGAGAGTSTISYTIGSCVAITVVTVNTQPAAITGTPTMCQSFTTALTDATAGGTWSSTVITVATVGTDGTVTGGGVGTSTISYAIGTCVSTQVVTVNTQPATITGNAPICQTFSITLSDATGGGTWSSVTTSVATITGGGVVTGGNVGTSTISYTIGSCVATIIVTVNTQPTAILGNLSVCKGFTTTLSDATGGGIWSSAPTAIASITGGGVVTGNAVGTATVSYTIGSCAVSDVVTVNTQPVAITGNAPICQTFSIILSDATGGGTWSSVTTSVATITGGGVVTGGNVGTSTISYTIGTCVATTVVTVNIQPAPISGGLAVCQGLTTTLSDATGGGIWSSVTTTVATITGGGVVTGGGIGTSTISYTIGSCVATVVVTVNSLPAIITGTKNVCSGFTTNLFDATSLGTWSSSNTAVATIGSLTGVVTGGAVAVTSTAAITYTVGTGCINTTTVTVNPQPGAILGANALCLGTSITLSDAGGGTWLSANPAIASITAGAVVTGNAVGSTTITYTLSTGCYVTVPMTVNPLPAAITGPTLVCIGSTITLSNGTGTGGWSSSNTGIATVGAATGVVTGMAGGSVTISYTLGTGCYAVYAVSVNAQPSFITPLGDTTFCPGGFVALTANTGAGLSYQWYVGGVAIPGANASSYIATVAGSYQVLVTNSVSCSTLSIPMLVTIDVPTAVITAASSTTICAGSTVTLDANTGAGLSYQWQLSGVPITGAVGSSYTASVAGDYSVIVSNATGCSATSNVITVSINPSPTANIVLSGPLTFCQNDSVVMTTDFGADFVYQWYNGAGAITGANGVSYTATTAGTYYVTTTNSFGCTATSINMTVVVNPLPNVAITASGSLIFCSGGNVTLSATAVAGDTYQWYRGGSPIAGATGPSYLATVGGGYRVMVTDPTTGCSDETHADTVVTVVATPVIVPVTPASFCWGGSALLTTSVSGAAGTVSYQWYLNGVIITGATGPVYNAAVPGNYSCQITIPGSCTITTVAIPVTEFPLPNPVVSFDGTYFYTGTFYVAYQWYRDLVAITGATTYHTTALGSGNYKVAVIDTNGCQSYSDIYVYSGGATTFVGNTQSAAGSIRIYPNPAQTMVHIESATQVRAVISSIDDRTILNIAAAKDIDISNLADGIYMIMLYDDSGSLVKAEKLVKTVN